MKQAYDARALKYWEVHYYDKFNNSKNKTEQRWHIFS